MITESPWDRWSHTAAVEGVFLQAMRDVIVSAQTTRVQVPPFLGATVKIPKLCPPEDVSSSPIRKLSGGASVSHAYLTRVLYPQGRFFELWHRQFKGWHQRMNPWWGRLVYLPETLKISFFYDEMKDSRDLRWMVSYFILPKMKKRRPHFLARQRTRKMRWLLTRTRRTR